VAKRPVEPFETQVTLPEWQLEPDEETYFGAPDEGAATPPEGSPMDKVLDEAGVPPETATQPAPTTPVPAPPVRKPATELAPNYLDEVIGKPKPPARQGSRPNQ
jgi:penicillin-binding protein 1A